MALLGFPCLWENCCHVENSSVSLSNKSCSRSSISNNDSSSSSSNTIVVVSGIVRATNTSSYGSSNCSKSYYNKNNDNYGNDLLIKAMIGWNIEIEIIKVLIISTMIWDNHFITNIVIIPSFTSHCWQPSSLPLLLIMTVRIMTIRC